MDAAGSLVIGAQSLFNVDDLPTWPQPPCDRKAFKTSLLGGEFALDRERAVAPDAQERSSRASLGNRAMSP
jgi:hypothetical protein